MHPPPSDRSPPVRSALTAESAAPGPDPNGATKRAEPPEATTALCAPAGSRSRNSVAPLCTASSSSGAIPADVSTTRTTDRLLEASGGSWSEPAGRQPSPTVRPLRGRRSMARQRSRGPSTPRIGPGVDGDHPGTRDRRHSGGRQEPGEQNDGEDGQQPQAGAPGATLAVALRRTVGEDHEIVTVVPRGGIERTSARHEPDLGSSVGW